MEIGGWQAGREHDRPGEAARDTATRVAGAMQPGGFVHPPGPAHATRRPERVSSAVSVVCADRDILGEAPQWNPSDGCLWWVDSFAPSIQRLDPQTGLVTRFRVPSDIGSFVFADDGSVIAGTREGFVQLMLEGDRMRARTLADPLARDRRLMLNDGKCDRRGRYWCASVHSDFIGRQAELFCLQGPASVRRVAGDFVIGNGIAISPDDARFCLADSRDETVWVWDFDLERGTISGKRLFYSTADIDGRVDGATFDTEGNYWCALVHGGAIACISPAGKMIERIAVPAKHPTMVAFGGPLLDRLYVSSASVLLAPEERAAWPEAGALFRIDGLGARGVPEPRFRMTASGPLEP